MKQSTRYLWLLGIALACNANTPQQAADRLSAFLTQTPGLGPGFAAVVVTADEVLLTHVQGLRNAEKKLPMTADTPIYIASQTKAFMGLLAVKLDQEGLLPLNRTIHSYWPAIAWPDGVNGESWTLRDLLTHQVPIECDLITFLEAYVTRIKPQDYPKLLSQHAKAREPGFAYDNLGYNIYAAILEFHTGKAWQDWLAEVIIMPMGMTRTSARTSDFNPLELSWNHQWLGEEKGWHTIAPKTDEMMQSAGGMVTSAHDMGIWLQAQLRRKGPAESGISQAHMEAAHQEGVATDPEQPTPYELPCSGYAMGWNRCDFEGHLLYVHGGGYTGARTMMAFSPDLGVGIGVFSNSDNVTGWFISRTMIQFLQYLVDHPKAEAMAELRHKAYPERTTKLLQRRRDHQQQQQNQEQWHGWTWSPSHHELAEYKGVYQAENRYLHSEVKWEDDHLAVKLHSLKAQLIPAIKDLFAAQSHPFSNLDPLTFIRDDDGNIHGFTWLDETFVKQN